MRHTDHPLRHYDRTCPACNLEGLRVLRYRGLPDGWRVAQIVDSGHYIVLDPVGEERSCITVNHWQALRWAKQLARESKA